MRLALLFPGQGSQGIGMGKALAESSRAARAIFERADRALGWSISKLCFEGPDADLTLTKNTQPAILTTSIAVLEALRERHGVIPAFCAAGHSLGEYSALVAAGALAFEDAVQLVHLRGKAMQEAVPEGAGAMSAILGGDEAAVRSLCTDAAQGDVVTPANFNAPGQIVIAGAAAAVARAGELGKQRNLKVIPLKVSAPFHCALMKPAAVAVDRALAGVKMGTFAFPVYANVDAAPNDRPERVRDLLVRQIDGSVLWEQSVRRMMADGVDRGLEVGPGKVVQGLVRKIDKDIPLLSIGDPTGLGEVAAFLK